MLEQQCDLRRPRRQNRSLVIGDLNELSDDALQLLLTNVIDITEFNTSEYDLLLCVIEWAWARSNPSRPATERRLIFDTITDMAGGPDTKILLGSNSSRSALLSL